SRATLGADAAVVAATASGSERERHQQADARNHSLERSKQRSLLPHGFLTYRVGRAQGLDCALVVRANRTGDSSKKRHEPTTRERKSRIFCSERNKGERRVRSQATRGAHVRG